MSRQAGPAASAGSAAPASPAGPAASAGSAAPADGRRAAAPHGPGRDERAREAPRLPPVRLAPREELAGSARVAPLLRAAREVARWLGPGGRALAGDGTLPSEAAAAMAELELAPGELDAAWRVAARTGMLKVADGRAAAGRAVDVLVSGDAEEVLA